VVRRSFSQVAHRERKTPNTIVKQNQQSQGCQIECRMLNPECKCPIGVHECSTTECKCQIEVHECRIENQNAECRINLQECQIECRMLNIIMPTVYNKSAQYNNGPLYIKRPITQKKTHTVKSFPKNVSLSSTTTTNIKRKTPEIHIH
jgi:hypothetical protein